MELKLSTIFLFFCLFNLFFSVTINLDPKGNITHPGTKEETIEVKLTKGIDS